MIRREPALRGCHAVIALVGVILPGCSGGGESVAVPDERTIPMQPASGTEARDLLQRAQDAAALEDADALCDVGVAATCRDSLARMARAGSAWPAGEPRVVFESRFGQPPAGGYVLTVCVEGAGSSSITDFVVFDGPPGTSRLRDPVYWSGARVEPALELGAPTSCDDAG
jgi:hypothetical protein